MKISIVIPAFNEEKLMGDTLKSVHTAREVFTRLGWESEVIVCDNNSNDRTGELARLGGASVVFEPVNQIGRARNAGSAAATGDWVIFIDADSHPSPELFADVAAVIQTGRYLAGGSTVKLNGFYPVIQIITHTWNALSRLTKWAPGSFIFCELAAFRQIGGFNNQLYAAEELDLSKRLKRLARERRKKLIILHRHPLLTSARKVHLYSRREHFRFLARTIWGRGKTLTDRDACHTWYDGRR